MNTLILFLAMSGSNVQLPQRAPKVQLPPRVETFPVARHCYCSPACTCGCNEGQECDCRQWVAPVSAPEWKPFQHNPQLFRPPVMFAPRMPMFGGGNCGPSG